MLPVACQHCTHCHGFVCPILNVIRPSFPGSSWFSLFSVLLSSNSVHKFAVRTTWPKYCSLCFWTVLHSRSSCCSSSSIDALVRWSIQLSLSSRRSAVIPKPCSLFLFSAFSVHVSDPYSAIVSRSYFLWVMFSDLISFLGESMASLAIASLVRISWLQSPLLSQSPCHRWSAMMAPRYWQVSTCSRTLP